MAPNRLSKQKSMGITIKGQAIDPETRCAHFHSIYDVVAIKFKCCGQYYPCYQCHAEGAGHEAVVWPATDFGQRAILCGVCKAELTIRQYLDCNHHCPRCHAPFNPNCANHYLLYFDPMGIPSTGQG